jgi:hypothetical protein
MTYLLTNSYLQVSLASILKQFYLLEQMQVWCYFVKLSPNKLKER